MKIGFITPEFPHEKVKHAAGLGTSIKNLVTALAIAGHQPYVFVYAQNEDEVFEENGVKFILIKDEHYKFGKWYFYRKHIQRVVQREISNEKIDILEVPDWTGISAFMKFTIPVVMRFHGSDTYFCFLEGRKQKAKNKFFEKLAVQGARAYIAPTSYAGKESGKLFGIIGKEIRTIHYGLELSKFQNDAPDNYTKGNILYIGTIIRKKGVLELPEIFKQVKEQYPQAKLLLAGSDASDIKTGNSSTWQVFSQLLDENLKTDVDYLGKVSYQQIQQLINNAHVCVFPTYAETLGMVTIESMAMKKPVVNSSIGWAQELMEDGKSGFLVHPSNHKEYADKIVALLQDDKLCATIGDKANAYVTKHFDITKQVAKNITFYKQFVK